MIRFAVNEIDVKTAATSAPLAIAVGFGAFDESYVPTKIAGDTQIRHVRLLRMPRGDEERYALDICDEVLEASSSRQHRFDFLRGDCRPGRTPRKLPVDAYYSDLSLVIE